MIQWDMIEYDTMVIDASDYFECPVKTRGVSIGGFYVDRLKQFADRLFANGVADRLNGFPRYSVENNCAGDGKCRCQVVALRPIGRMVHQ